MIFSKYPDIPLIFNFNSKPSYKTLSKVFEMSRKTPIFPQYYKMIYKFHG